MHRSIRAMYGLIIRGQYHFPKPHWDHVSAEAIKCVKGLMNVDPKTRFDCEAVLADKWIKSQVDVDKLIAESKTPVKMESALEQVSASELKKLTTTSSAASGSGSGSGSDIDASSGADAAPMASAATAAAATGKDVDMKREDDDDDDDDGDEPVAADDAGDAVMKSA